MNIKDAIDYTRAALRDGKLTPEHVMWLVEFFQRGSELDPDGKAGPLQTMPALLAYIAKHAPPREYKARGSGYYPTPSAHGSAENRLEGGPEDRHGFPLRTLQDFLRGAAEYVSCAMDLTAFPYGTKLRIPELEAKHGKRIDFRVVDTGAAFKGKGTKRIDICTASKHDAEDATINGPLTLVVV